MNVLIKWNQDWADEFDMTGLEVMSLERWEAIKIKLDTIDYPLEASFGTNEAYYFESKEEIMEGFSVTEVFKEDMQTLNSLFGNNHNKTISFGWTPIYNIEGKH